jgi:NADH:ubiquinone oxidoreductase subunit 6 (subunit J)
MKSSSGNKFCIFFGKCNAFLIFVKFFKFFLQKIMETIIFYIIFIIIILSALFILFTKNVVYAAFALLLTFTGIAGIYVFLVADVVAVAQLMIYVGGILILLIFGIMFTSKGHDGKILTEHQHQLGGGLLSIFIACLLFLTIFNTHFENLPWIKNATILSARSTIELVGLELMTDNVLALEVVGVLLLVALIGTALIAGRKIIN